MKLATLAFSLLVIFQSLTTAAAQGPYPLLNTTPPYVCQKLLLGAKWGEPKSAATLKAFETLIGLRYDVTTIGLDKVLANGDEGMLILPNHETPNVMVLMSAILGQTRARPVMTEDMLVPGVKQVAAAGNSIIMPSPLKGGKTAAAMANAVMLEVNNALDHGDNILAYPSATVQSTAKEYLGNKSMVQKMLEMNPNRRIVLARSRGMWGSSWTRGYKESDATLGTGKMILRGLLTGIGTLAANLVVLTPKRPVEIEFFEPTDFPRTGTKAEMNRYMEAYYNSPDHPEKRSLIKHFFWSNSQIEIIEEKAVVDEPGLKGKSTVIEVKVPEITPEMGERLIKAAKEIDPTLSEVELDRNLDEMGFDSLSRTKLLVQIGEEFKVQVPQVLYNNLQEIGFAVNAQISSGKASASETPNQPSKGWLANPASDNKLVLHDGETVTELIVKRALSEPNKVIGEDLMRGPVTYKDLLTKAVAISEVIRKIPGVPADRIGVLLPPTPGNSVIFTAAELAEKTPVYINFTTELEKNMKSIEKYKLTKIITSRAAVNNIGKLYDLSGYYDRFVYLEDLKLQILNELPGAMFRVAVQPNSLIEQAKRLKDAVALFTSGSSGAPKAVLLSHENLSSNIRATLDALSFKESDRMLSVLPPFHSFGNIVQLLSTTLGMPTVYHTSPLEPKTIVDLIKSHRPTLYAGTPDMIMDVAKQAGDQKLDSIRLIFTGASPLTTAHLAAFKKVFVNASVVEGYGLSETSPILAANTPEDNVLGSAGVLLANVEHVVVDENFKPVPVGEPGLLLVRGPSIFNGYWEQDNSDTFVIVDGKKYFNTKDFVVVNEHRRVWIKGRGDRMTKHNGEKVQHEEVEAPLFELAEPLRPTKPDGTKAKGPLVVVECAEHEAKIVAFTSVQLTLAQVQRYQRDHGVSGNAIVQEVRMVPEIPMLGTGKAAYKVFKKILVDERKERGGGMI